MCSFLDGRDGFARERENGFGCLTSHAKIFQLCMRRRIDLCGGGLKKKFDLRPGSQRHRQFVGFFKANMKSYIPLETTAIFFLANLFLKQGIG